MILVNDHSDSLMTSLVSRRRPHPTFLPANNPALATTPPSTPTRCLQRCDEISISRRNVHFAEWNNQSYPSPLNKEDYQDLYYSRADIEYFRVSTLNLAKELARADHQDVRASAEMPSPQRYNFYWHAVGRTYTSCCASRSSSDEFSPVQSAEDDASFHSWRAHALERWGMEFLSMKPLAKGKRKRRALLQARVASVQQMFANEKPARRAQQLQRVCAHISRPSRFFAWQLAQQPELPAAETPFQYDC